MRVLILALSLGVSLALSASIASAQEHSETWNQEYDPHVAAFGLAAGFTSGTGLAVRWPVLPQTMATVAGGAWGNSDDLAWNLGVELHLILRQVGRTRFFAGPALAAYSDDSDRKDNVNTSLNIGVETLVRPRVSVKADVGFTYLGDSAKVYPLPQLAIFFYF